MGEQLLSTLDPAKQRYVYLFIEAHRHAPHQASELDRMKFVTEAMTIVADTKLTNEQKKVLVTYMYTNLATDNQCGFTHEFNIGGAIDFIWDTARGKYSITVKRRGCFDKLMCCASATVTVDTTAQKVDVRTST